MEDTQLDKVVAYHLIQGRDFAHFITLFEILIASKMNKFLDSKIVVSTNCVVHSWCT